MIGKVFSTVLLLSATLGASAQEGMTVTTNKFVATGATMAFARSVIVSDDDVTEEGVCWSTSKNPTLLDSHSTDCFYKNGKIFKITDLTPSTFYYVRAYAKDSSGNVAYGNAVKIATLPQGNIDYTYDNGGTDEVNARITNSLEEMKYLYRQLTSITDVTIKVYFDEGTTTASCYYGGPMNVGPNPRNQLTGTILHEANHAFGVGTQSNWKNNALLRENTSRGKWLGRRANEMVRFLENDDKAYMTGDDQHMWPGTTSSNKCLSYGVNGEWEDVATDDNKLLYYGNVLITHAHHQDGLLAKESLDFATPAYVFTQDDDAKYYLKCESDKYATTTGFLTTDDSDLMQVEQVSKQEALVNDKYAWQITYNPVTCLYIIRNIGTGRYFSFIKNRVRNAAYDVPGDTEEFQMMPSQKDYTIGTFSCPTYGFVKSKTALKGGSPTTSSALFTSKSSSTDQRWLVLDEEQLEEFYSQVEATAIREVKTDTGDINSTVYNLNGVKMNTESLPKGVYIKNGKKVVVK